MDNKITLKDTGEMVPAKDVYEIITYLENELEQKENELEITSNSHILLTLLESINMINYKKIIKDIDNVNVVESILRCKKQNINQDELNSALVNQCELGRTEIVKLLLANGADIHAENDWALRNAVGKGHIEIVKLLIEHGADVHAEEDNALFRAVYWERTEIVKLLITSGANVHVDDEYVLRWAAGGGHIKVVELLLEQGVDLHARNNQALRYAARYGKTETVKLLLEHGADASALDDGSFNYEFFTANGTPTVPSRLIIDT